MNQLSSISQSRQQGYVLLTTIVLMIMLTVLAVSQVSLNTSQTRVAANVTDSEITFEKTEGAVNEAINNLKNGTYNAANFLSNSNGFYLFDQTAAPLWKTINWASSSAVIQSFQGKSGSQASYFIEKLPSVCLPGQNCKLPSNLYRITARALGANGNSSVIIQTTLQVQ